MRDKRNALISWVFMITISVLCSSTKNEKIQKNEKM